MCVCVCIIIINYSTCIHLSLIYCTWSCNCLYLLIINHSKDSLISCLAGVTGVTDLIDEGVIDTLCLVSVNIEAIMVQWIIWYMCVLIRWILTRLSSWSTLWWTVLLFILMNLKNKRNSTWRRVIGECKRRRGRKRKRATSYNVTVHCNTQSHAITFLYFL